VRWNHGHGTHSIQQWSTVIDQTRLETLRGHRITGFKKRFRESGKKKEKEKQKRKKNKKKPKNLNERITTSRGAVTRFYNSRSFSRMVFNCCVFFCLILALEESCDLTFFLNK
jgi:hypothetical protein